MLQGLVTRELKRWAMVVLIKIVSDVLRKSNLCTWNPEVAREMEMECGGQ